MQLASAEEAKMTNWIVSKKVLFGFVTVVAAVIVPATVFAQVEQPSQITIQGTGFFAKSSTNQSVSHDETNSGGLLVGYSYQFKPRLAVEGNYGFTLNTQNYDSPAARRSIETEVHEVMAGLMMRIPSKVRHVRPYVLGRSGVLIFNPTDKSASAPQRQTRMAFVYGGGADFDITAHFGLRAEYRGLIYKVPDFSVESLNLDKFSHLAQPSVGFFVRF